MKMKSLFAIFVVLALTAISAAQNGAKSALRRQHGGRCGIAGPGLDLDRQSEPDRAQQFLHVSPTSSKARRYLPTYSGSITVTPFVGMGLVLDTKGYEWNNKIQPQVGVKVEQVFPQGRGQYRVRLRLRRPLQKLQQQRTDALCAGLVWMAAGR